MRRPHEFILYPLIFLNAKDEIARIMLFKRERLTHRENTPRGDLAFKSIDSSDSAFKPSMTGLNCVLREHRGSQPAPRWYENADPQRAHPSQRLYISAQTAHRYHRRYLDSHRRI